VADTASRNVTPIRGRVWCVTRIATIVGSNPVGNRQAYAASQRCVMTRPAAALWSGIAGHVLCVIELHIEALFELIGKSLPRGIGAIHILMTDKADRATSGVVLSSMTLNAVFVAGKAGTAGIVGPVVTVCASNRGMLLAGMEEF
jgi:hypothetical protein